jgi:hypothetical protein
MLFHIVKQNGRVIAPSWGASGAARRELLLGETGDRKPDDICLGDMQFPGHVFDISLLREAEANG